MRRLIPGLALILLTAVPAGAQTRAEIARQARAEKSQKLHPYVPDKVERALYRMEHNMELARVFAPPKGVFLRMGGLPPGGGFALGPAYRYSTHKYAATASGVITRKGYWDLDANLRLPHIGGRDVFATVGIRQTNMPQEDFFGMGQHSSLDDQVSYLNKQTTFYSELGASPVELLGFSVNAGYLRPRLGAGKDPTVPSIEELFDDEDAPGLNEQPGFLRFGGKVTLDYTERPLGPLTGGRYTFAYDRFFDQDLGRYGFSQWFVDLQQYIPIVTGARTIVLRGMVTDTRAVAGQEVPFYFRPTLGGGNSLRGLLNYRLRDRSMLLLQAEYRFELNAFMTGVVFYDAGKVGQKARDLRLDDLNHDYGFGLRLGFMSMVSMRAEIVFGGGEGVKYLFKFTDVF